MSPGGDRPTEQQIKAEIRRIAAEQPGVPLYGRDARTQQTVYALGDLLHQMEDEGPRVIPPDMPDHQGLLHLFIGAASNDLERQEMASSWDRAVFEPETPEQQTVQAVLHAIADTCTPVPTPYPQAVPIVVWTRDTPAGREGSIDRIHWFSLPEVAP